MTKQDILNNTGLSEEEFYQRYPDQETFCSDYPEMCPDMIEDNYDEENVSEEDIDNYQNLGYDEDEISMAAYGGSLYKAQDGVQQPAPYTDYNQYQKAMQNYGAEASKASAYNNFQNDLYNQSGTSRGSRETTSQMGDMFNTLSPEQQDALAEKYGAQFMPSSTPSSTRRNYINSMQMNVPGKGTGYYSFPTNDVVYGNKQLERPKYDFPAMTAPQYKMSDTPLANFQGKPINYQPGTANINFGNTTPQPKKFFPEPTQLINNIGASYKDPASLNASNGNLPIPKYSMANTMERVGATNKPYVTPTQNYTSIVDLLKSRNQDSSFSNRKKLAEEAGIKNYTGSASQNMDFIRRINSSKASGAGMTSPSQTQNQEVMNPNNPVQLKNVNFSYKRPITNSQNQPQDQEIINSNNPVQLKNVPFIYKRPQGQPQTQSQQGNKPFYGPGNTLIGSTDDNRQFYPGKYTGASNNQSNLQDKELLANSEKLKQYVQSKDNYKFESGGVNIHPAMRNYFQPGGSKMNYGDFMEYVEEPEMVQVDGIRSQYEPETNTIFYGNPKSIPDELAHAVQRANRDIGYSVPPNYNSMMRELPEMQNVYPINRKNLDPFWVNENAGALNTIREINVPDNSNNSLSRTHVKKFFPGDRLGGNSYLKKLNDSNIYYVPGSGEYEAHQLIEPRIREDYFNYNKPQFKQGGYYGMDGRLHRAKGSGTYVMNGGYYFDPGGENTTPPVASPDTPPGAMGDSAAVPQSSLVDNNSYQDYSFDMGTDQTDGSSMGQQSMIDPYDPSKYSSSIDPATGFTNYSKNNQAIKNIKKQDPALWNHLKDEGKGARWRTGQTDFQKFGRTAGYIGNVLENGINVASGIGNIINNRNEQINLNNSAINKGSTASMYSNPQGAGKGTGPGQTGSSYGMMDPSSIGARSFTGMYGKYGMEVPKFQPGGGFSNLFSSAQSVLPVSSPINLMPNMSFAQIAAPVVDNTGGYQNNRAVNDNQPVDNNQGNSNTPIVNKRGGSDVATRLNNPRNLIYTPVFTKLFGAKKSSTKQTDGKGYFAEFPSIEAGLKAAETQLFGEVDGVFQSDYYNANTDVNIALKTWSGGLNKDGTINSKGYGVEIYPELKGKTLSQITAAERRELQRRQIKAESGAMYKILEENGVFNNKNNNYMPNYNYTSNTTVNTPKPAVNKYTPSNTNFSLKNLIDFAKTNKWVVTSTTGGRHNLGSRHGKARAIDVSVKNKTPQQISDFMKLAQSQGYRVLDERVRPKGQKEWHGAHLHLDFEKGGQFGGQVMEMDEDEITQFLKAGGQLEFLD